MRVRHKLLLAQLPLALALLVAGLVFVATVADLGRLGSAILKDNYRSVLAAQRMKDSIERIDSGALFQALGERAKGRAQAAANRTPFELELHVEQANITEPGEQEAVDRLGNAWADYRRRFERFDAAPPTELAELYFDQMEPAFLDVKRAADAILDMNQDAMVRRSDRATQQASSATHLVATLSVVALLAGILSSTWLTSRLLRRLESLASAVRRISAGDLGARAEVVGTDELAEVAAEFNGMAEHLAKYRQSSLGALLQAQQASQAAIDSLPDPVLVLDLDSNVTEANEAASRLLRLETVAQDQSPIAGVPPDLRAAIERVRDHVLGGKGPYVPHGFDEAVRVERSDGDVFLLPRATPLYGEARAVEGATVILQDISRLRRLDELRSNLVATVAHEFRTPLTSLQMAIHLCAEQSAGPITEQQADLLYAAREDCHRLQTIVDELLDLARLRGGAVDLKKEARPPRALVDEVLPAFELPAGQKFIALAIREQPGLPNVVADPERAKVVLSNLLVNAIRHAPVHSTVAVRIHGDGAGIRFEIADDGPGVPPEHRDRVFERFYRVPGTQAGGAGLGLSIAREIVEAHGGSIGLASPEGQGSVFWFTLPSEA